MASTRASREAGFVRWAAKPASRAPPNVLLLPIAAQRNAGKLVPARAQFAHQVMAAAVRQSQIAEQQVKGVLAGQFQSRGHVAGRFDVWPSEVSTIRIIFAVTPWSSTSKMCKGRTARRGAAAGARCFGLTGGRGQRQPNAERRALVPALAVGSRPCPRASPPGPC